MIYTFSTDTLKSVSRQVDVAEKRAPSGRRKEVEGGGQSKYTLGHVWCKHLVFLQRSHFCEHLVYGLWININVIIIFCRHNLNLKALRHQFVTVSPRITTHLRGPKLHCTVQTKNIQHLL